MADSDKKAGTNSATAEATQPIFRVLAQYIKDLSFENPNAPQALRNLTERPQVEIEANVAARKVADTIYEVELTIEGSAEAAKSPLYKLELVYGGVVQLERIPEEAHQAVLFVNTPMILFPFARRLIADITRESGFAPLMIDPIDFATLYTRNVKGRPGENATA